MGYDYGVPMADNEALHIHLILQMYWDIVWKTVRNRMLRDIYCMGWVVD